MNRLFLFTFFLLAGWCCGSGKTKKPPAPSKPAATVAPPVKTYLLPLGKTTDAFIRQTYTELKQFLPALQLLPLETMPDMAYYKPRNRYRADSLIKWMRSRAKPNEVYLGITMQDISTTKGDNPDYGVMGLGYQPGQACVASNFRVRNKKDFYKVAIHELGHTAGLPHCPDKTCFMRDAEGADPTGEEKGFCPNCKAFLKAKGWRL